MTTRVVRSETDRELLLRLLSEQKLPFTCDVVKGAKRSIEQNRLNRLWMNEISEQLGDQTPEEIRAYCKAYFGVPILRAENTTFCDQYDRVVKPLTYEQKLELMGGALDLPVTRIMTTDQKTRYLDAVYKFWTEKGIVLTEPDAPRRAA